jgi:hypothetical protein
MGSTIEINHGGTRTLARKHFYASVKDSSPITIAQVFVEISQPG